MRNITRLPFMLILSLALGATLLLLPTVGETGSDNSPAKAPTKGSEAHRANGASGTTANPVAAAQTMSIAEGGKWEERVPGTTLFPTANVPVHISLLPDGRLLYWGRDKDADGWDTTGKSSTYLVDTLYLDHPSYTTMPSPTPSTNLFCSGHSFLPDGRLLVTGGHIKDSNQPSKEGIGEKSINIFDYRTNLWTKMLPDKEMEKGRWYPYNVTMPSGDTLIIAGTYRTNTTYPIVTDDNKEPSLRDLQGNVSTLRQSPSAPRVYTYPYISLAPDGRVFIAKPSATQVGLQSLYFDPYAPNDVGSYGVFTNAASPRYRHWEGTSVHYAPGKMLLIGGSEGALSGSTVNVATAESFDMNQPAGGWTEISSMAQARQYATATLLPDGKVLVTGGTSCGGVNRLDCGPNSAVQTPELWDPANPSAGWKQMNPTTSGVPRVYHSFGLLLPDARVMIGGGGLPAAAGERAPSGATCAGTGPNDTPECRNLAHKDVEIFSPPYLYNSNGSKAVRPAIVSAPDSIAYGQQFLIDVGNVPPSTIQKVVLVRLPSVTHAYNQDQRRVDLGAPVAYDSRYVRMQAPADGKACPPGPYMMFLISNNGRSTPSIAKIIRVGDLAINREYPANGASVSFTATGTAAELSGRITVTATPGLAWTATSSSSWLTITSGGSGVGNGTVSFSLAPNTAPGATKRAAAITVAVPGRESGAVDFMVYQAINFSDATANPVIDKFIAALYARSITAGCEANSYCPDQPITRAQTAVFLTQILLKPSIALPEPVPGSLSFADAEAHVWRRFISYIMRRGIPDGCSPSAFCPGVTMTRRDMIVWTIRGMGIDNPPAPSAPPFHDVPLSDPAAPFIAEAARRGLTAGCGGGYFCGNDPITRGSMAVFLGTAFGL